MDFTKLEGTVFKQKDKLTRQNKVLRRSIYIPGGASYTRTREIATSN
jgi:hypothetical protein